jgi:hypothetical protein
MKIEEIPLVQHLGIFRNNDKNIELALGSVKIKLHINFST